MAIEVQAVKKICGVNCVGIHNSNGINIFNLTPHDIIFDDGVNRITYPGNKISVRIEQEYEDLDNEFGLPFEKECGNKKVIGLPEEEKYGTFYIVSSMVRKELPERKDLISPTNNTINQKRNENGWTISISRFQTNL